ncbi:hypothetical protein KC341_g39 [Hortaea werneckii]|nr:hypothetical protein KC341_g39 [Hortaea werneckii]
MSSLPTEQLEAWMGSVPDETERLDGQDHLNRCSMVLLVEHLAGCFGRLEGRLLGLESFTGRLYLVSIYRPVRFGAYTSLSSTISSPTPPSSSSSGSSFANPSPGAEYQSFCPSAQKSRKSRSLRFNAIRDSQCVLQRKRLWPAYPDATPRTPDSIRAGDVGVDLKRERTVFAALPVEIRTGPLKCLEVVIRCIGTPVAPVLLAAGSEFEHFKGAGLGEPCGAAVAALRFFWSAGFAYVEVALSADLVAAADQGERCVVGPIEVVAADLAALVICAQRGDIQSFLRNVRLVLQVGWRSPGLPSIGAVNDCIVLRKEIVLVTKSLMFCIHVSLQDIARSCLRARRIIVSGSSFDEQPFLTLCSVGEHLHDSLTSVPTQQLDSKMACTTGAGSFR